MIMKQILYTLLALFCIGMTACDNDDSVIEATSLDIIESTVDFEAIGGEGFIKVENGSAEMKVLSDAEWCSIKNVTNDKITFDVALNESMATRSAIVKMEIAGKSKQVCITQVGVVSQYETNIFYAYSDNVAITKTINFSSTLPISVTVSDDAKTWLSYVNAEGGFVFTGTANDTGSARMGKATIKAGRISIDYYFLQYDIDDLCGVWNVSYSDGEAAATDIITIVKGTNANGLKIRMQGLGYSNITADYQNGSIKIPCGQAMGKQGSYSIFFGAIDSASNYGLVASITCQLTPYLNKDKEWGLALVDNGSWKYNMVGFAFWAKTASGTVAGYWDLMLNPSLSKATLTP